MRKKGIVMESGNDWAILLMNDGRYERIRTERRLYEGQEHIMAGIPIYKSLAVAAVLLIVLTFSFNFFPVVAYASFSSGVELGLNRWGQIVYARVTSENGEKLIAGLGLWGRNIETALPEILNRVVAVEQDESNPHDIVVEIINVKDNDQAEQSAMERFSRAVAAHTPQDATGHWNLIKDKKQWRWEKEKEKDLQQIGEQDYKYESDNSEQGTRSRSSGKDKRDNNSKEKQKAQDNNQPNRDKKDSVKPDEGKAGSSPGVVDNGVVDNNDGNHNTTIDSDNKSENKGNNEGQKGNKDHENNPDKENKSKQDPPGLENKGNR